MLCQERRCTPAWRFQPAPFPFVMNRIPKNAPLTKFREIRPRERASSPGRNCSCRDIPTTQIAAPKILTLGRIHQQITWMQVPAVLFTTKGVVHTETTTTIESIAKRRGQARRPNDNPRPSCPPPRTKSERCMRSRRRVRGLVSYPNNNIYNVFDMA